MATEEAAVRSMLLTREFLRTLDIMLRLALSQRLPVVSEKCDNLLSGDWRPSFRRDYKCNACCKVRSGFLQVTYYNLLTSLAYMGC
jgi:hypothetical protein